MSSREPSRQPRAAVENCSWQRFRLCAEELSLSTEELSLFKLLVKITYWRSPRNVNKACVFRPSDDFLTPKTYV